MKNLYKKDLLYIVFIILLCLVVYSYRINYRYYNVDIWDHTSAWYDKIKISSQCFFEYFSSALKVNSVLWSRPAIFLHRIPMHYFLYNNVSLLYFFILIILSITSILIYKLLNLVFENKLLLFIFSVTYILFPSKNRIIIDAQSSFVLFGILFFFLSIYLYIKYLDSNIKKYQIFLLLLSIFLFVISINTVELAMPYIVVFILLEFYFNKNSYKRIFFNISIIFLCVVLSAYWKFVLYHLIFQTEYHKSVTLSLGFLINRFHSQTIAFFDINFGIYFWRNYIIKGIYNLKSDTFSKLIRIIPAFCIIFWTVKSNYYDITKDNKICLKNILLFFVLGLLGISVFIPSGYILQHYHNHLNGLSAVFASITIILVISYLLKIIFTRYNIKNQKIIYTLVISLFLTSLIPSVLMIIEKVNEQEVKLHELKLNLQDILPETVETKAVIMTNYPLWLDVGFRVEFLKHSFPYIVRSLQNNYVGYDINGLENIRNKVNTLDKYYIIFDYRRNKLFESVEIYDKIN